MLRPYGTKDRFRGRLDAGHPWSHGMLRTEEVLARAARRSAEEAQAVRESAEGTPNGAFLARAGDLARSQCFLSSWVTLAGGERLGRAVTPGFFPLALSPRALVIWTVASDLYLGYATLRERARWFPDLVGREDWGLAHRRGAGRLLDTAEALGGP